MKVLAENIETLNGVEVSVHQERKTFQEAVDFCESQGSKLYMPTSSSEFTEMINLLDKYLLASGTWFPLVDIEEEGTIVWYENSSEYQLVL